MYAQIYTPRTLLYRVSEIVFRKVTKGAGRIDTEAACLDQIPNIIAASPQGGSTLFLTVMYRRRIEICSKFSLSMDALSGRAWTATNQGNFLKPRMFYLHAVLPLSFQTTVTSDLLTGNRIVDTKIAYFRLLI